jgi:hypothetical protein
VRGGGRSRPRTRRCRCHCRAAGAHRRRRYSSAGHLARRARHWCGDLRGDRRLYRTDRPPHREKSIKDGGFGGVPRAEREAAASLAPAARRGPVPAPQPGGPPSRTHPLF